MGKEIKDQSGYVRVKYIPTFEHGIGNVNSGTVHWTNFYCKRIIMKNIMGPPFDKGTSVRDRMKMVSKMTKMLCICLELVSLYCDKESKKTERVALLKCLSKHERGVS